MQTFSQLLKRYAERIGISDAELARAVGVRRQTVFRWKEGTVARPRSRDDVLAVSRKLRLSAQEADELLIAAGFHPEGEMATPALSEEEAARPDSQKQPPAQVSGDNPAIAPELGAAQPGRQANRRLWLMGIVGGLLLSAIAAAVLWLVGREALPVAAPGETLVVVGQFTNFTQGEIGFNVAGRIAEPLRQTFAEAALPDVRVTIWPDPIPSESEAQATLTRSGAWMVIWGEYDSGRVLARFAQADSDGPAPVESLAASPAELFATINSDLPQEIRYLALLTLGTFYLDKGNYPQARAVLTGANASPPQETDARTALLLGLGLAYQVGDDPQPDKAIGFYDELLALAPDQLVARYNRGLAFLDRQTAGDQARALADFEGVLQRNPNFLAARIGRGVALLYRRAEGDATAALQEFSYVIQRDDQRTMAYYNRGLLAIRLDNPSLWETDLQRTVELAPEFAGGHSALCWGYVLDAEPQKALPVCDRAVALGANEALHSRGMAFAQAEEYAQASTDLRAFLGWLDQQPATSPYRVYRVQVEAWLSELAEGQNPVTREVLATLRD